MCWSKINKTFTHDQLKTALKKSRPNLGFLGHLGVELWSLIKWTHIKTTFKSRRKGKISGIPHHLCKRQRCSLSSWQPTLAVTLITCRGLLAEKTWYKKHSSVTLGVKSCRWGAMNFTFTQSVVAARALRIFVSPPWNKALGCKYKHVRCQDQKCLYFFALSVWLWRIMLAWYTDIYRPL